MSHIIAKSSKVLMVVYGLILALLLVYSYALIDPNLTFFNSSIWTAFRNRMVYLGYYQRPLSWNIYLTLVALLFLFHFILVKKSRQISVIKVAFLIGAVLMLSYPFLSHDFFNYLFDAKIATFYHQNPYFRRALDFPQDEWTRFMHRTHRTYPYGPVFLVITLVPSFLSFGKFLPDFILFKLTFIGFYLAAVYSLSHINKKSAIEFATHPLVIIEGLVNAHNDLIGLSLALFGIYYLFQNKKWQARLFLLLSGGIKYVTMPLLFVTKKHRRLNLLLLTIIITIIVYVSWRLEIESWYFLTLFAFMPVFNKIISRLNIFLVGLLLSYYPYIYLGGWDTQNKLDLKHQIIGFFLVANVVYLLVISLIAWRRGNFSVSALLSSREHTSDQT